LKEKNKEFYGDERHRQESELRYASRVFSNLVKLWEKEISANLISKTKAAFANAFGGGVAGLVPAYV